MLEIIFHGRGGQGAKSAVNVLSESGVMAGKNVLGFPEYGPERTGAPMRAFLKIDDKKITSYQPIQKADVVVVLDESLLDFVDVLSDLKNDGVLLLNTSNPDKYKKLKVKSLYCVDATKIALNNLGANKPNFPMVASLLKVNPIFSLRYVVDSIRENFTFKIGKEKTEQNIASIQEAYIETLKVL